jgi:hypothetical protein
MPQTFFIFVSFLRGMTAHNLRVTHRFVSNKLAPVILLRSILEQSLAPGIDNSLHRVDTPFSERSAGFVWFFFPC